MSERMPDERLEGFRTAILADVGNAEPSFWHELASELLDSHDALSACLADVEKERDRLQHIIDCANTPLMRDVLAELDEAREALREARAFAEMVLACDTYGCENGPGKCLHADASKQLNRLDAALHAGTPKKGN